MEVEAVSMVERSMQEDFSRWDVGMVDDMCEGWSDDVRRGVVGLEYYDGQTWKRLDPSLVERGEREDLDRFTKMGAYAYVRREEAMSDQQGKIATVKWVRINKGRMRNLKFVVEWFTESVSTNYLQERRG